MGKEKRLRGAAFLRPVLKGMQAAFGAAGFQLTYARVTGIPDANLYHPKFSPWRSEEWRTRLRVDDPRSLVDPERKYVLYTRALEATRRLPGDLAECGVYKGGTAYLLAQIGAEAGRKLALFDTFEGMPETDAKRDLHQQGDFADTSLDGVRKYLGAFPNVECYPGFVPQTLEAVKDRQFCFVHLDLDIYEPTLAASRFFYDRLAPGGVLLYDDYGFPSCPGARAAVDAFFAGKREVPLVLGTGQCLVQKL